MTTLKPEKIKLMLLLSDPKHEKPIQFTRSMLYTPNEKPSTTKLSELPYFIKNRRYPADILLKMPHNKRINFFFNLNFFKEVMYSTTQITEPNDISKIIKDNIELLIKLLFPTYFPAINNHTNSFDKYIQNNTYSFDIDIPGAIKSLVPGFMQEASVYTHLFTYLKIEGSIYTITKTIWLNDFINHPVYHEFLEYYKDFKEWKTEKTESIVDEMDESKTKFNTEATQYLTKLTEINTEYTKIFEKVINIKTAISTKSGAESERLYIRFWEDFNELYKKVFDLDGGYTKLSPTFDNYISKTTPTYDPIKAYELDQILKKMSSSISFPDKPKRELFKVLKIAVDITNLETIKTKYFGSEINIRIENNEEYERELKNEFTEQKYKKYFEFVKKLRELDKPVRESTNIKLQKMIYNYIKSIHSTDDFTSFLNELVDEKPILKNNGLCDVEISTSENNDNTTGKYEIYLQMDVIGGELNNTNLNQIKCSYMGEKLGQDYKKMKNKVKSREIEKKHLFFDIKTDGPDSSNKKNEEELKVFKENEKKTKMAENKPVAALLGGKRKTRKYIRNNLKYKYKKRSRHTRKYVNL